MNEVLIELIGRLRERMPELSLIDEDYGQLETDAGDQYPVTFPCVLLSGLTVQWEEMGAMPANIQRGTAEMTVRLGIDCYDDTHAGSGTTDRIADRARLLRRLTDCLHGYRPRGSLEPVKRVRSRPVTTAYGVKVYETTYRWRITERLAETS